MDYFGDLFTKQPLPPPTSSCLQHNNMDLPSVPVAELRGHNGPIHIVRFTGELLCFGGAAGGEFHTSL